MGAPGLAFETWDPPSITMSSKATKSYKMKVPNILISLETDNHPAMLAAMRHLNDMSKIRYIVAMTLDGYVAGPNGEADWILMDPDVNFAELWAQFDTLLMGRKTYDAAKARLGEAFMQGRKTVVVSRTLRPADHPNLTILSDLIRD